MYSSVVTQGLMPGSGEACSEDGGEALVATLKSGKIRQYTTRLRV